MSTSAAGLNIGISPTQYAPFVGIECPYAVFYPPPTSHCSAIYGDGSYAIWGCNIQPALQWDNIGIWQAGGYSSDAKFCGPKTRLGIKYSYSVALPKATGFATSSTDNAFYIAIRLSNYGDSNNQPFFPIFVAPNSNHSSTSRGSINIMRDWCNIHSSYDAKFGYSINVVDAINYFNSIFGWSNKLITSTFIIAIQIASDIGATGYKTCPGKAIYNGMIVDPDCRSSMTLEPG